MSKKAVKKKLKKTEDKSFWGFLFFILIVSLIAIIIFSQESVLTGHTVQTIAFMEAGGKLFFEVKVNGLKDITMYFLEEVKDLKIEINEIDSLSCDFRSLVYSRFKISSNDDNKIGKVKYTLKVKKKELLDLGINFNQLRLYLDCQVLETKLIKEEGQYYYYQSESEGISQGEYLIGLQEAKVETVEEETPPALPGEATPEEPRIEYPQTPTGRGIFQKVSDFFKNLFR